MNKAQLVEAIADKVGGRQNAADAVDAVLDAIVRAVVAGDRVYVAANIDQIRDTDGFVVPGSVMEETMAVMQQLAG